MGHSVPLGWSALVFGVVIMVACVGVVLLLLSSVKDHPVVYAVFAVVTSLHSAYMAFIFDQCVKSAPEKKTSETEINEGDSAADRSPDIGTVMRNENKRCNDKNNDGDNANNSNEDDDDNDDNNILDNLNEFGIDPNNNNNNRNNNNNNNNHLAKMADSSRSPCCWRNEKRQKKSKRGRRFNSRKCCSKSRQPSSLTPQASADHQPPSTEVLSWVWAS